MDDNIWEYPFGDVEEDDEIFYHAPVGTENSDFKYVLKRKIVPGV